MKHIEQKDIVKYLKKGEANGISFTYNRGSNVWELKHKTSPYIGQEFLPGDLKDFDYRGELIEDLDDEDLLDIISKYGKDVVAIEWSTRGYSQGDYIKGIAYVTKEKYDNEVCDKEGDWKEDCAKIIDNEVKSIGMIEIIRYRLPVYWACALINDDYTGLSEEEIREIDAFLRNAEGYPVDVDLGTQGFYRCNDAGTLPGECADFIFHKCND